MIDSQIRQILFLTILLFVILSSGSLQCALNCYDHAVKSAAGSALANDCHPLSTEHQTPFQVSSFCHHSRSADQLQAKTELLNFRGGQVFTLFDFRSEAPAYRSAEPFVQPLIADNSGQQPDSEILPLSQKLKRLRSTILLM